MKRISHDMAGTTQRIAKLGDSFTVTLAELQEIWKDDKGRAFMQQHTAEINPTVQQLVATMSETIELFEGIARKVQDPDQP